MPQHVMSMEWFIDEPRRGMNALMIIVLVIAVIGVWLGRKRLLASISVALVFVLLAAIAIPGAIPARSASQRAACINNLNRIREAKHEWVKKYNKQQQDTPSETDIYGLGGSNAVLGFRPECPRGGAYVLGALGQNPTCTFSNKGHRID